MPIVSAHQIAAATAAGVRLGARRGPCGVPTAPVKRATKRRHNARCVHAAVCAAPSAHLLGNICARERIPSAH
eukprot:4856663-Prymnesium_polylepis.1